MRFRDNSWWVVFVPLLLGHLALAAAWVYGGWRWAGGLFPAAGNAAPWLGALAGLLAWWSIGALLDWAGYRVSARVTRGRYEFQPLAGPLAGWTLPVTVLL
ncbi:MAG TPA: hypothetical protein VM536_11350, partial [Chloroflexia bacterium]|nr:hypothetical protein [Chloroflexia bacterium]